MTADKTFLLKTVFRESAKGKAVLQEFTRFLSHGIYKQISQNGLFV